MTSFRPLTTALLAGCLILGACQTPYVGPTFRESPDPIDYDTAPTLASPSTGDVGSPIRHWTRLDSFETPQDADADPEPEGEKESTWHTFGLRAGASFLVDFDTELRLYPNDGSGTGVRFEDDLGFSNDSTVLRIDSFYRFNRHHRVNLSYYDIERTSGKRLETEIEWNGETYPIGVDIAAFLDTEILKLSYQWTFLPYETWEIGASFGFHWMRLGTGISLGNSMLETDFTQDLPLPVFGLHGEWHLTPSIRLRGSSEFLYLELSGVGSLNSFDGYIVDNVIAVEADVVGPVGLGVGYNYFIIDTTFGGRFLSLDVKYAYQGVLVYGMLSF